MVLTAMCWCSTGPTILIRSSPTPPARRRRSTPRARRQCWRASNASNHSAAPDHSAMPSSRRCGERETRRWLWHPQIVLAFPFRKA